MDTTPHAASDAPDPAAPPPPARALPAPQDLGAELRESLLLLGLAVSVTVGLTAGVQAALRLLG